MRTTLWSALILVMAGCASTAADPGLADDALSRSPDAEPAVDTGSSDEGRANGAGGSQVDCKPGGEPCVSQPVPGDKSPPGAGCGVSVPASGCAEEMKTCIEAEGGEDCLVLAKRCSPPLPPPPADGAGQPVSGCAVAVPASPEACVEQVKNCQAADGGEKCTILEKACAGGGDVNVVSPVDPKDCPPPPKECSKDDEKCVTPVGGGAGQPGAKPGEPDAKPGEPGDASDCLLKVKVCLEESGDLTTCLEIAVQCPGITGTAPAPASVPAPIPPS